jgi:hypothetical protein
MAIRIEVGITRKSRRKGGHRYMFARRPLAISLRPAFSQGRVALAARSSEFFAKTTAICWKFGEAAEPARAAQFDALCAEIRKTVS